ncbi:hypothetical protein SAMN04488011_12113, partial [Palleronia pelagia]
MADPSVLNPHPPEFDRFLQASVGEDRNGYAVTVLSTLARSCLECCGNSLAACSGHVKVRPLRRRGQGTWV